MKEKIIRGISLALACLMLSGNAAFAADEQSEETTTIATVFGDIDGNGAAGNSDLVYLAKAVIGLEEPTGYDYINSDINKDGLVNNADIVILGRSLIGFDVEGDLLYLTDVISEDRYNGLYDPERLANDSVPGELLVYFKFGVGKDVDFKKLFPELDIANVKIHGITRTWVLLILEDKSKENVTNAVNIIKDSPYVYSTFPNYTIEVEC